MDKIVFYTDVFIQGGNRLIQGGGLYTHCFDEKGEEGSLSVAVGGAFRWKDAFIPIIKLYTHQLSIGLSYDVNISKLTTASQFGEVLNYRYRIQGCGNGCRKFGEGGVPAQNMVNFFSAFM